jgi:hypothetical protein
MWGSSSQAFLDAEAEAMSDDSEISAAENGVSLPWIDTYYDSLVELYGVYTETGKKLFGPAFNQLGDFGSFATYVFCNLALRV